MRKQLLKTWSRRYIAGSHHTDRQNNYKYLFRSQRISEKTLRNQNFDKFWGSFSQNKNLITFKTSWLKKTGASKIESCQNSEELQTINYRNLLINMHGTVQLRQLRLHSQRITME